MLADGHGQMQELLDSHYASAGALADRLGMGVGVRDAIHHTFERWDGTGLPRGVGGEAIPIEMRVVHVADVTEVHLREPRAGRRGRDGPATQRHPFRSAGRGRASPRDVRRDLGRTGP